MLILFESGEIPSKSWPCQTGPENIEISLAAFF